MLTWPPKLVSAATGRSDAFDYLENGTKALSEDRVPELLYLSTYCKNRRAMMGFGITPERMRHSCGRQFYTDKTLEGTSEGWSDNMTPMPSPLARRRMRRTPQWRCALTSGGTSSWSSCWAPRALWDDERLA